MDYTNYTTESRKHKHLNLQERVVIELRVKDAYSAYKIAKELHRPINTILNEIRRGTVSQIKNKRTVSMYLADAGQAIYENHRINCGRKNRRLVCDNFISYVCDEMRKKNWSIDACIGSLLKSGQFKRCEAVCTKTFYNYVDQGLTDVKNIDLPLKVRRNTKKQRVRANKKKLGTSIEKRDPSIDSRKEFGHWEIDTVIGEKSNKDNVLLTIAERKTRKFIVRKIADKSASAVMAEMDKLREECGERFSTVFKTITGDNGSEFAKLSDIENETDTAIYFTHPYSSFEKGTNERHNGLIRRFLPKGTRMADCSLDTIAFVEDWCNTLPRKILGYRTPEELFDSELDRIYAA
jgi:transposase, IS30 family